MILKDHVFPELNRPVAYFGTTQYLHLVAGYKPPILSTFPSGHTATAFSIGLYLSILSKQNLTKYILFIVAFFVGYSRMYLSAHFPADVVGGATLGVIITLLCYYLSLNRYGAWGDKKIQYKPNFFSRGQKS
jgi:membrane-associated phospholipid phosphatase